MARKKVEAPTREELITLTGELNNILGLDPAIKVSKKMTDEELIEKIKEIATDNVYESDCEALSDEDVEGEHFYSEDAVKVFGMLGIEIAAGSPPEAGVESAESDEDVDAEDVVAEDVVAEKTPAKGKKEKAAPAEKPVKEKKEKAPAKEKTAHYSRANAFVDAVKKLGADSKFVSYAKIAEVSNEFYVNNGGKDNLTEAKLISKNLFCKVLLILGFAEQKDETIKILN